MSDSPSADVDTRSVRRRSLSFPSLSQAVAEAESLAAGEFWLSGNQTYGQLLEHLAKSIDANVEGVQAKFHWFLRPALWFGRTVFGGQLRKAATTRPMPAGMKLPKVLRPEFAGRPDVELADGLAAYRRAADRLASASELPPHPVFGPISPAEAEQLHCRHAELHLSFVHPGERPSDA